MPSVKGSSAAALRRLSQMEAMVDGQIMTKVNSLQSQIDGLEVGEVRGEDGKSAYQIWLDAGNTGSQTDFLNEMKVKGDPGTPGNNGSDGQNGTNGNNATDAQVASKITEYMASHPAPKGQDGSNASVTVGQVQTVSSTDPAEVTNAGNTQNAVLNFKIPRGTSGSPGPTSVVNVGNITLAQTAALAIVLGIRTLPNITLNGVIAGEALQVIPTGALPVGYAIHNAVAVANNTISITLSAPALALGASYSIPCRVVAFR